jgi:hypothetical protein
MLRTAHLHLKENLLLYLSGTYESYGLFSHMFHSAVDLVGPFYDYPHHVPSLMSYDQQNYFQLPVMPLHQSLVSHPSECASFCAPSALSLLLIALKALVRGPS